jgi:hypothetical protein
VEAAFLLVEGGILMNRGRASPNAEGNDHPTGKPVVTHHHHSGPEEASTLPAKDKLIIRLRHALQHHQEHGETYRRMAEEARDLGEEEAARLIQGVAEETSRQTEDLAKALAALGSA